MCLFRMFKSSERDALERLDFSDKMKTPIVNVNTEYYDISEYSSAKRSEEASNVARYHMLRKSSS